MAQRISVLVAESDPKTAKAVGSGLGVKGFEVLAASDSVSALQMARKEKPDMVVLSARLAGGGSAALMRLRSNVYTTHIPVIAIADSDAHTKQMMGAGATECFSPPLDYDKLQAAIQKNLLKDLDFTEAPQEVLAAPDRVADLNETGLVDSPPDASFDLLTRLASKLCNAPTALVTLVTHDRQFFKSQVGLAQPWAGERQTRLSHSFCQWVVSGNEGVTVDDATQHPTLKTNLAIRDLGVVAYAGIPLHGRKGQAIGSFCAIDSKRREWTAEDLATLEDLARITRAFAVLGQAHKSQTAVRNLGRSGNLHTSVLVAGNAILGAAHILQRHGMKLDDAERDELLAIIESQAEHLARSAT